ncbi:MAG: CsgG/HfaB family protein [candidate division WOR-3 bacterium]
MRNVIFLILISCATGYYAKGSVVKIDKTKNYKIAIIPQLKSNYLNEDDLRKIYNAYYLEFSSIKNFTIVEREKIEEIIKELNFQYSGLADVNNAKEFGKLAGADLVATYEVISASEKMDDFLKEIVRELVISIKIIDIQTGEVLYVGRGREEGFSDKLDIIEGAVSNSIHALKLSLK